jgi:hypothetical protein
MPGLRKYTIQGDIIEIEKRWKKYICLRRQQAVAEGLGSRISGTEGAPTFWFFFISLESGEAERKRYNGELSGRQR